MKTFLLLSALFCGAFLLQLSAASTEDLQAGIEKLTREARNAKEEGRNDAAEQLMAQSKKLQAELRERKAGEEGRRDPIDFHARASRELAELERAGKGDQAEQLRRKLAQAKEGDRRRDDNIARGEGDGRKHHVMEAIKHLRAAGLNEPAEHLERMAREMRDGRGPEGRGPEDRGPEGRGPEGRPGGDRRPDELHAATREMHAAMQEMREQMRKMQHQLEELRAQTAKKSGEERQ